MDEHTGHHTEHRSIKKKLLNIYKKKYKNLLIIPILLLVFALMQIGFQYATTGDFLNKGISLKGGTSITLTAAEIDVDDVDIERLSSILKARFPEIDIDVREQSDLGERIGLTVEATLENKEDVDSFKAALIEQIPGLTKEEVETNIASMGSTLGESFFQQTFTAILIAFIFMGLIVFYYFGENTRAKLIATGLTIVLAIFIYSLSGWFWNILSLLLFIVLAYYYFKYSVPCVAVILAAFSDIVITLAIVNMIGFKIGTAGIAAFLMLIGYSVDTDILLSTRVLKRKEGTVFERTVGAMVTGLTMNFTTIAAIIVAMIFTQSAEIKQIMIILLIGLCVDIINTWLENAAILRWHLEKKYHDD